MTPALRKAHGRRFTDLDGLDQWLRQFREITGAEQHDVGVHPEVFQPGEAPTIGRPAPPDDRLGQSADPDGYLAFAAAATAVHVISIRASMNGGAASLGVLMTKDEILVEGHGDAVQQMWRAARSIDSQTVKLSRAQRRDPRASLLSPFSAPDAAQQEFQRRLSRSSARIGALVGSLSTGALAGLGWLVTAVF